MGRGALRTQLPRGRRERVCLCVCVQEKEQPVSDEIPEHALTHEERARRDYHRQMHVCVRCVAPLGVLMSAPRTLRTSLGQRQRIRRGEVSKEDRVREQLFAMNQCSTYLTQVSAQLTTAARSHAAQRIDCVQAIALSLSVEDYATTRRAALSLVHLFAWLDSASASAYLALAQVRAREAVLKKPCFNDALSLARAPTQDCRVAMDLKEQFVRSAHAHNRIKLLIQQRFKLTRDVLQPWSNEVRRSVCLPCCGGRDHTRTA